MFYVHKTDGFQIALGAIFKTCLPLQGAGYAEPRL